MKKWCVFFLGYGKNQGYAHKSKPIAKVSNASENTPEWFNRGVNFALLAPTAVNQQNFYLELDEDCVSIKAGLGFYTKVDLGIVKYHFEVGAGKENFNWRY